jgi:hypothetical protein
MLIWQALRWRYDTTFLALWLEVSTNLVQNIFLGPHHGHFKLNLQNDHARLLNSVAPVKTRHVSIC